MSDRRTSGSRPDTELILTIKKHTNMKYTVVIVETLSRKIEVDASDAQQAKQIIAEQYNNEQIVLSADDFYGYEIETL